MDCKYKVNIKNIQYNYKVRLAELQEKYKFNLFCTGGKYDDTEIREEIASLEEENEYLNSIVDQLPKVKVEGEYPALDNTLQAKMKVDLKGNTSQFSTTGKNLIPNIMSNTSDAGVTFTKNSDGTISLSGTASASTYVIICDNITINGQVTLSSGVGRSNNYYLRALDRNNNYARLLSTRESGDSQTPTATINTKIQVVLNINSGANCNGIVIKPMLELGNSATTYEEYTGGIPAPSPSYPYQVNVVTGNNSITISNNDNTQSQTYPINLGNIELCKIGDYQDYIRKSTGKNLFDKNSANIIQNKYLNDSGVETSDNNFSISDYIKVDANTVYSSQPFENKSACICFYNSSKTFLSSKRLTQIQPNFTTPNNCEYIRVSIWNADINILQIEKGSTATSYETYGKVWYIHKDIGKVVLDGSESWSENGENTDYGQYSLSISNKQYGNDLLSDKFLAHTGATGNYIWGRNNNNNIYITIAKSIISYGLTSFKTWLSTHNTEVYYVLATPTTTEITDSTLISQLEALKEAESYLGQTNISQVNNDAPFIIDATALYDLNNLITRVAILETE